MIALRVDRFSRRTMIKKRETFVWLLPRADIKRIGVKKGPELFVSPLRTSVWRRSHLKKLLSTLAMFAALAVGADLTGSWSGTMQMTRDGETRDDSAHLVLKQNGTEVTGSVGPNADKQLPITKGTIEGSNVVLEATTPDGEGKFVLKLKVDGDKLTGELAANRANGEDTFTGKMTLSRVK